MKRETELKALAENGETSKLTRRQFVTGASIASAALLAGTGNPSESKAAPVPKKWDKETDIVVLGAGGAGLLASIEAAEAGAKVIILESEPVRAGSTPISAGLVVLCETEMQPGTRDELYADLMEAHRHDCDPALVRAYVDHAGDTYKRMKESGVKFRKVSGRAHMKKLWGHEAVPSADMCNALEATAKKKGVEFLLNNRAKRFVTNPRGTVVGVEADISGRKRYYKARKAVIIATGGFTRNPELSKNFGRPGSEKIKPLTGPGSRGDGLIMGWSLGADMTYMTIGVGPTAPADKETVATDLIFYAGAIIVNKNGKRFYRESELYSDICWVGLQQPDTLMFQIYDAKIKKAFEGTTWFNLMKGAKEYQDETLNGLVNALNKAAGLNIDATIETVNKYNGYVDAGNDLEFGRKYPVGTFGKLLTIDTPPFYAVISVPGTTHYDGGLKINPGMQVLNVYGEAIPRVYAAGEVTGGFHGAGYMSGSAVGMAVIFGRIAGMNAAKEKSLS